jgi:putative redox protein
MINIPDAKIVLRDEMILTGYQNGYSIPLDASLEHGGHDAGISPMKLMLLSLAGCASMDVISILRKKRQRLTGFEAQVSGTRADEHPRVWTEVWVKFLITGHDIDPEAVERSIELSRDKYCGVAATMSHTTTIHYDYEIIAAKEQPA